MSSTGRQHLLQTSRSGKSTVLFLEFLESRDQPSALPFTLLDSVPWLDLDFRLSESIHGRQDRAGTPALPCQYEVTSNAEGHPTSGSAPLAVGVPAPRALTEAGALVARSETALLLAASAAAPISEPRLISLADQAQVSETGSAGVQWGYRFVFLHGPGIRSGPDVQYATFIGGVAYDEVRAVAIDNDGNTYLAGATDSGDPIQDREAFVAKLDSSGQPVYVTVFGGVGFDEAAGVDVDREGNAYVSGTYTDARGITIAFVAKLNPDGDTFLWRTNIDSMLFPPVEASVGGGLRLSPAGDEVHAAGTYYNSDTAFGGLARLRTTNGTATPNGLSGWGLPFSQVLGQGVGIDAAGSSYVATTVVGGPTGPSRWLILAQARSSPSLRWSTLSPAVGGAQAIAVDPAGNSYSVGSFETPQGVVFGEMKLSPSGGIIYRFADPVVEGTGYAEGNGIAIDAQGRSYVTGTFLTANGDTDVLVSRITPRQGGMGFEFDLDTLTFGGSGDDLARGLAVQLNPKLPTYAVVGGLTTLDADFPITDDAAQPFFGGGDSDGFVARTRLPGA